MKKRRQKRVRRAYPSPVGLTIYNYKSDMWYRVIDVARINNTIYLLAESDKKTHAIYKIVDVGKYVKLTSKRLLEKKHNFEISENWEKQTKIAIEENGKIVF